MHTFFLFGKYSAESIKGIQSGRTKKALELIKKNGGEVKDMYALLGEHDLVIIVLFPGIDEALKTSVALCKLTGILFTTAEAVSVEKFDKLIG